MTLRDRLAATPLAVWVSSLGLLYVGVALIPVAAPFAQGGSIVVVIPFIVLPIVGGIAALKGKRWSFGVAAGIGILFLLLFGTYLPGTLANPADPSFWYAVSALPALLLVAGFSILGALHAKTGISQEPYLMSFRSTGGLATSIVVGFVIGAIVIGAIAAGEVQTILANNGAPADIRIVPGAAGAVPQPYTPALLTVAHGSAVVWVNGDTTTHTVTSNTTGLFDSGSFAPGVRWSHLFSQAGNYSYYCTLHAQMAGKVVVT